MVVVWCFGGTYSWGSDVGNCLDGPVDWTDCFGYSEIETAWRRNGWI